MSLMQDTFYLLKEFNLNKLIPSFYGRIKQRLKKPRPPPCSPHPQKTIKQFRQVKSVVIVQKSRLGRCCGWLFSSLFL